MLLVENQCPSLDVAFIWASQVVLVVKSPPANARDIREAGLIPGLGRSPGEGNGNPLQYSCLGNPMDRGAWWAAVPGVAASRTQQISFALRFHALEKEMATHSSVLPRRIPGMGGLVGCQLWGCTESDTTEVTAAAATFGQ